MSVRPTTITVLIGGRARPRPPRPVRDALLRELGVADPADNSALTDLSPDSLRALVDRALTGAEPVEVRAAILCGAAAAVAFARSLRSLDAILARIEDELEERHGC